jgi:fermentation-respiration switch protein FrsA (DUF1100 family)
MINILRGLLLVSVGLYLITFIVGLFFSDQIIFQPQVARYRDSANILKLTSADGAKISAVYLANRDAAFTVLFSHGNAEDIGDDRALLEEIKAAGFAVLAFDYQGYGTSQGKPSERHVYEDEDAAYNFLVQSMGIEPDRIIVFGRSVGSGPACDLASRRPSAGLILQSPFTSAFRVMTKIAILPFDKFNNLNKIRLVHCPVLVIHGTADSVINISHGRELFAAANQPKQALWVQGANHNDLEFIAGRSYLDALKNFESLIRQRRQATGSNDHS